MKLKEGEERVFFAFAFDSAHVRTAFDPGLSSIKAHRSVRFLRDSRKNIRYKLIISNYLLAYFER